MQSTLRTIVGIGLLSFALPSISAPDSGSPVELSVPLSTALALRGQLAGAQPAGLLDMLGLTEVAELHTVVPVAMRDGTRLSATLILPRNPAARSLPVILIRSPYAPADELSEDFAPQLMGRLVRVGYGIVLVNDRGTQWSEGRYQWLKGANNDGYDTLEWISHQAWSNGKVGTFGCSSSGESQPPLATVNHPAHKAMVEMAGATAAGVIPGFQDQGIFYHGGVPDLAWSWWYRRFGLQSRPLLPPGLSQDERERVAATFSPESSTGMIDFTMLVNHLPSGDIMRASGVPMTEWDRLIKLNPASSEWQEFDFVRTGDKTQVPGLHIDSWYDAIEAYPTVKLYQALSKSSPNQHLVMGPTAHCRMGSESEATSVGERTVGDGRFDYVSLVASWFDRWLKEDRTAPELPPIQYYVLNSGEWRNADSWPPKEAKATRLYLQSAGHANSLLGDGLLSDQRPASMAADVFISDPAHPVPSLGGSCCSDEVARDQSAIEARQDVLVYTTEPFAYRTRLVGDVAATVYVAVSTPDTDLMLKLVDVDATGHAYNLSDTALRLRYRDGINKAASMKPDEPYRVTITGIVTATDILPGHRLRIEIAGSNFPNYERNLHSGGLNYNEDTVRVSKVKLLHGPKQASFLEISVMPR